MAIAAALDKARKSKEEQGKDF